MAGSNIIPVGRLDEIIEARVFRGTKGLIKRRMRQFKGRWDNESHFIRAALMVFDRQLEREATIKKLNKVRR